MNKSVMLSIQPKWCELIASGEKTIEIRKTAPKIQTPFKCYIYCTQGNGSLNDTLMSRDRCFVLNGKVIGEFVVDSIDEFLVFENKTVQYWNCYNLEQSCLTYDEIGNYIGANKKGYAWHISDLKIYDKPKELGEFKTPPCEKSEKYCEDCKYKHHDHNGEIYCKDDNRAIINPPQSWYYVEA